ncbi:MAG: efflux RND transporter periplasmic adaptor subunit [Deltaproteobacteria bacterium]|nr:efflux RND transporter periplasmic adaptor subunit [Deltaproteobacteria bacterium]
MQAHDTMDKDFEIAPPQRLPGRPRWGRWLAAVVAVAAAAGGGWWWSQRPAPPKAAVAPSGPRVQGDSIEFPANLMKSFGIAAQPAERRTMTDRLDLTGKAAFDPEHVAAVGTRTKGLIHEIKKFEGDRVKAGDVLAVVESTELAGIQAVLESTAARVEAARANADREHKLLADNLTTAREAEQAKAELAAAKAERAAAEQHVKALLRGASGRKLGEYELRSPIDGVVVERHVSPGQAIEDHIMAFRVADLHHLWVELTATDRQLRSLKVGDPVEVAPLTSPEQRLTGKISYIGDVIDPLTGTAPVRLEVVCEERMLRPGQAVRAVVTAVSRQREVLAVPREAVTWIDGRTVVFVQETPTRLRMVPVEIGGDDGQWQEVRAGLQPGQNVVTKGVFAVKGELYR